MKNQSVSRMNISNTRWAGLLVLVVVVGSVMAYGLISFLFQFIDKNSAISMLFMVVPMTVLMFIALRWALDLIQKRMDRLTDAISRVGGGDLSVQIDTKDAGEYAEVYEDFNRMVRELSATKREMQAFTDEFAHEFKTPISSIRGFADYLVSGNDTLTPEQRLEYLEVIQGQSKRLQNLSMNTLLLSKMDAMEIVTDKEMYNLGEQLRQCAIVMLPEAEKKRVQIGLPEELDLKVTANREMMEHVWINLLGNAVKFTPEGGSVRIAGGSVRRGSPPAESAPSGNSPAAGRFAQAAAGVWVSISDTGCGMDEATRNHIFERFYQNDTKNLTKGNGMGLAIVKRIVELHGGMIEVKSAPGRGSTFIVRMPQ